MQNRKASEGSDFKFQIDSLTKNFDTFVKDSDAKGKELRKQLKELEEQAKSFEKKEKVDGDKREIELKLKDHAFKIDRLERREDPAELDLRLTKTLAEHSEKIQDTTKRLVLSKLIAETPGGRICISQRYAVEAGRGRRYERPSQNLPLGCRNQTTERYITQPRNQDKLHGRGTEDQAAHFRIANQRKCGYDAKPGQQRDPIGALRIRQQAERASELAIERFPKPDKRARRQSHQDVAVREGHQEKDKGYD